MSKQNYKKNPLYLFSFQSCILQCHLAHFSVLNLTYIQVFYEGLPKA